MAPPLSAFTWPSAKQRIARELAEGSVEARRHAADRLVEFSAKQAEAMVLQALDDEDHEVRLRAARAAAHFRLLPASEKVLAWLADPDARIRLAACELLRRAPMAKALAPLGRVLSDPDALVRLAAVGAIAELESIDAVAPLLGRLDDPNEQVRLEAVQVLARLGDARAVFGLIGKMGDHAPEVRAAVARALGELGDARAASALMLALRDKNAAVRVASLEGLGRLGRDEAAFAIVPLLEETNSPEVRRAALLALGKLGSEHAVDALIRALDGEDANSEETSPAIEALILAGNRAEKPLLAALALPTSPNAAAGAAVAISQLETEGGRAAILDAMQRGAVSPEIGLRALSRCGGARAIPAILELLSHTRPAVRRNAVEALIVLLDPSRPEGRAVEPLAAALQESTNLEQRVRILRALGRTGSKRAADVLAAWMGAREAALRLAAIEELGRLGPMQQDDVLMAALEDASASVRLRAAVALASSASEKTLRSLLERIATAAEADRGALGLAVSGAMARARDPEIVDQAERLLASSGGAVRDAVLEGIGRMPSAAAGEALAQMAKSAAREDRRKVAEALAGHPKALSTLIALSDDADAGVRAAAAWSLGTVAPIAMPQAPLERVLARFEDIDGGVVANAIAAAARIAKREPEAVSEPVTRALCHALEHPYAHARANALAGLALLGARCNGGDRERAILRNDTNAVARTAAAELLYRAPAGDGASDRRALSLCLGEEKRITVAERCRGPKAPPRDAARGSIVVFVVPDGAAAPVPGAPFAMLDAEGFVRSGSADRRGAVFEHAAPSGTLELVAPEG